MKETNGYDQLFLFAHCSLSELHQHVRLHCEETEIARLPELTASWKQIQPILQELHQHDVVGNTALLKPLDGVDDKLRVTITKTFPHFATSVHWVDIDTLIAPQRNLDLDYIENLKKDWPKQPTEAALVNICFGPGKEVPIRVAENATGQYVFSSANKDLRFLGTHVRRLQSHEEWPTTGLAHLAVTSLIGFGSPLISILKVNNRLILHNGFHRVYALRTMGVRAVPVVVQHIQWPQRELPTQILGISRDFLLQSARPALMKDFFDLRLSCRLRGKSKIKTIQTQITVNQQDIAI